MNCHTFSCGFSSGWALRRQGDQRDVGRDDQSAREMPAPPTQRKKSLAPTQSSLRSILRDWTLTVTRTWSTWWRLLFAPQLDQDGHAVVWRSLKPARERVGLVANSTVVGFGLRMWARFAQQRRRSVSGSRQPSTAIGNLSALGIFRSSLLGPLSAIPSLATSFGSGAARQWAGL
jgi:hypothetical protein